MLPLALVTLLSFGLLAYRRGDIGDKHPRADMTDEQIRREWRKLGFFCERDDHKRLWTLTGDRRGLLYFPDLLLGYVADPKYTSIGKREHYGPYGSLELLTWPDAGLDGHAIRGSAQALTHLAELVEQKLAFAEPGSHVRIRAEYSPTSPYSLLLDIRADGFDPASEDRARLGVMVTKQTAEAAHA